VVDFDDMMNSIKRPFYYAVSSIVLLIVGFVIDLATPQELVAAITYNIPIALAGLRQARRFSYSMVGAALIANLLAAVLNANQGDFNTIAIINRVLSALSFLLVGYMTLELSRVTIKLTTLSIEKIVAERDSALRELLAELSGPLRPQALLERTVSELRERLKADAVVIVGVSQNQFTSPRVSDPEVSSFGVLGKVLPWFVSATAAKDNPIFSARVDKDLMVVGRWYRQDDDELVVMVKRPKLAQADIFLGEALRVLESLYERAKLLENLDAQRTELGHRNTVIRDLVYAFSHDIRTPLMANGMNMKLALEGAYGEMSDAYKQTLQNGIGANDDLLDLADSLLLLARYESGEERPTLETTDLVKLVNETIAHLQSHSREKDLHMVVSAPQKMNMLARPNELKRVLQNLLDNAIKFSPDKATVNVTLYRSDESTSEQGVALTVTDHGAGIPAEQQSRLFQRFSTGKAGGGIGLGLYLAKQIIESHGGRIHYEPGPDGGSIFKIWLPVAPEVVTA
jgi:signal transduction histidine kinase